MQIKKKYQHLWAINFELRDFNIRWVNVLGFHSNQKRWTLDMQTVNLQAIISLSRQGSVRRLKQNIIYYARIRAELKRPNIQWIPPIVDEKDFHDQRNHKTFTVNRNFKCGWMNLEYLQKLLYIIDYQYFTNGDLSIVNLMKDDVIK